MNKKPFDLKRDPKFLAKVQRMESKATIKVFKHPVEIFPKSYYQSILVAAIGVNGCYLIISHQQAPNTKNIQIHTSWTEKNTPTNAALQSEVARCMAMWLITSAEDDFEEIPHAKASMVDISIKAVAYKMGIDYFKEGNNILEIYIQGYVQEIKNPYKS